MIEPKLDPERTCPACGGRFSWAGKQWLFAEPSGRTRFVGKKRQNVEPAPEITRCPSCHAPLSQKGTVTEESV